MIITCPHCQTKYQVAYEAIGAKGRKVQCANCNEAWRQAPVDEFEEPPVAEVTEDALDEVLEAVAAAEAPKRQPTAPESTPKIDPALERKQQSAFLRRQLARAARQPLARTRRVARIGGALLLSGMVGVFFFGRVEMVERYPDMAGVYEAIGLSVNVVGLEFSDVASLRTLRDGKDVLMVSAQIVGVERQPSQVPPVVVTLLDDQGHGVYEWSVTPQVRDLMAGERATFDTQLTQPPPQAAHVRLSFTSSMGQPETPSLAPALGSADAVHEAALAEPNPTVETTEEVTSGDSNHSNSEHH